MATTAISTIVNTYIKTRYPQPEIRRMLYETGVLLGMLPKEGNAPPVFARTVEYGGGPGAASTFATAQANVGQPPAERFTINTYADEYGIFRLSGQVIAAALKHRNSVVPEIKSKANGTLHSVKHSVSRAVYGSGAGDIGQISSGQGTSTLTLTNKADLVNMYKGMTLVSDSAQTGATASSNTGVIGSIDREAGTITVAGGGNWHSDFDDDDYLFRHGDPTLKIEGLASIIPAGSPAALWGVTRTNDREALAGWSMTGTAGVDGTLERFFLKVSARIQDMGGKADCIFMNSRDWAYFANQLGSRVVVTDIAPNDKAKVRVNYQTIEVMGTTGRMRVFADAYCPKGVAYVLTLEDFKLHSLAENFCDWLDHDNLGHVVRMGAEDSVEGRVGGYLQLSCAAPGHQATCDISDFVANAD